MKFFVNFKNFIKSYTFTFLIVLSCVFFFGYEIAVSESSLRKKVDMVVSEFYDRSNVIEAQPNAQASYDEPVQVLEKEEIEIAEKEENNDVSEDENEGITEESSLENQPEEKKEIISTKLDFPEPEGVFKSINQSYFDDALFIGDSRTICLQAYGGWNNASYYTSQGVSIWKILEEKIAPLSDGTMGTIEQALAEKQFRKIYIMLGVNELATGTADSFLKQYKLVMDKIISLQPDATIFVQAIVHVSREKSDSEKYINNFNINDRNRKLATLADNKKIFFIDANKVLDDETGALTAQYTFDGVHLTAKYLPIWKSFLLKHGVEIPSLPEITEEIPILQ